MTGTSGRVERNTHAIRHRSRRARGESAATGAEREALMQIAACFTSHGFRRTLTDLLRNAQVDPVIVAGLAGHETERMRRHYSTVRSCEAVEAGERVVRLLQPQTESVEESGQESTGTGHEKSLSGSHP